MKSSEPKKGRTFLRCFKMLLIVLGISATMVTFYVVFGGDEMDFYRVGDEDDEVTEYLIDTPGCKIPKNDPWDPSIRSHYHFSGSYVCKGSPSILSVKPNASISLDETILRLYYEKTPQDVACTYRAILRSGSVEKRTIDKSFRLGPEKTLAFDVPLGEEFVRTKCTVRDGEKARKFVEYLPLVPLKASVESRCELAESGDQRPRHKKSNVIFLGIDSVSRLNFVRHFPKTYAFLKKNLPLYSLKGYNKVGDNTFPNLVPMLTGHAYGDYYYTSETRRYFDDVDFTWKKFAELGYRTLLAEDAPEIATFNYYRNGFKKPPTDYYYRPFALATEKSPIRHDHCLGNKMEMGVIYDYLRNFVQTMDRTRPYFAFVFLARLTHDVFNNAGYADEPTYQLLSRLYRDGHLDDTFLFFFSDHGIRFSEVRETRLGEFEERRPFFHVVPPRWFSRDYPELDRNLRVNERRLSTPFDVHATALHLVDIDSRSSGHTLVAKNATSLFEEISPLRTCDDAAISPHWCTCLTQKSVSVDDDVVIRATTSIVKAVNALTLPFRNKCLPLKFHKILDARVNKWTRNSTAASEEDPLEYFLLVSVKPGGALLEATVRCGLDDACVVVDEISRINRYNSQSDCVNDAILKKFCYCK